MGYIANCQMDTRVKCRLAVNLPAGTKHKKPRQHAAYSLTWPMELRSKEH